MAGITLLNGATTTAPDGGIRNAGTLVLDHVTLSGNTAMGNNGGGLYNSGNAVIASSVFAGRMPRRGRSARGTAVASTTTAL